MFHGIYKKLSLGVISLVLLIFAFYLFMNSGSNQIFLLHGEFYYSGKQQLLSPIKEVKQTDKIHQTTPSTEAKQIDMMQQTLPPAQIKQMDKMQQSSSPEEGKQDDKTPPTLPSEQDKQSDKEQSTVPPEETKQNDNKDQPTSSSQATANQDDKKQPPPTEKAKQDDKTQSTSSPTEKAKQDDKTQQTSPTEKAKQNDKIQQTSSPTEKAKQDDKTQSTSSPTEKAKQDDKTQPTSSPTEKVKQDDKTQPTSSPTQKAKQDDKKQPNSSPTEKAKQGDKKQPTTPPKQPPTAPVDTTLKSDSEFVKFSLAQTNFGTYVDHLPASEVERLVRLMGVTNLNNRRTQQEYLKCAGIFTLRSMKQPLPNPPIPVPSTNQNCKKMSFKTTGPVVALSSIPGSGNSWIRQLLESATGIYTGAVYCDTSYVTAGMIGEGMITNSVLVVKMHFAPTFVKNYLHNEKAIYIVRSPFAAILAENNRNVARVSKEYLALGDSHVMEVDFKYGMLLWLALYSCGIANS